MRETLLDKMNLHAFSLGGLGSADLFLRIRPNTTTVHQGDLFTYAFPVWNLGPDNAVHEVLTTQVPEGTTLDYVRISGTPGLGTCTLRLRGNRRDCLRRKQRHGPEHDMDSESGCEGNGTGRDSDHRKCDGHGGYDRSQSGQ